MTNSRYTQCIFILLFSVSLSAFAAQGEMPRSWQTFKSQATGITAEAQIPTMNSLGINPDAELKADIESNRHNPLASGQKTPAFKKTRVAVKQAISSQISPRSGQWDTLDGGEKIWRMAYQCDGATDVSLSFSRFNLPDGVKAYVHNGAGGYYDGPHTSILNSLESLTLPVVPGDEVILEVNIPATSDVDALDIAVKAINCGYRDLFKLSQQTQPVNNLKQGSCNIDVACVRNANNNGPIQSVGRIIIDGTSQCSGSMLNDLNSTGTPYFFTAGHCGLTNNFSANNSVVYWNFESPNCGQLSGGSLAQNTVGATLEFHKDVNATGVDHSLIRLNTVPPRDYNVYYNGIDTQRLSAPSVYSVHHPRGDEKAYAAGSGGFILFDFNSGILGSFYEVRWSQGTTETGSSGSPLFFNNRLIGVLTAGNASCTNPNGFDIYSDVFESRAELATVLGSDSTTGTFPFDSNATFLDVPVSYPFFDDIEALVAASVTAGCGVNTYCPSALVTRAEMAIFIIRALEVSTHSYRGIFTDVSQTTLGVAEIEAFSTLGITGGCGGGKYCPGNETTRGQMAVFLLKAINGGSYTPPPAVGMFSDVAVTHPFAPWIEQLSRVNITGGCGAGKFCPDAAVSRGQMAAFLVRAFNLN